MVYLSCHFLHHPTGVAGLAVLYDGTRDGSPNTRYITLRELWRKTPRQKVHSQQHEHPTVIRIVLLWNVPGISTLEVLWQT